MQQFIEFSLRHWELWLAFIVILILLLTFELHARLTGTLPLSVQDAIFKINREDAIFLDVRDVLSFKKGHIAESVSIPFSELKNRLSELDSYRERPIIINYSQGQSHHKIGRLLKNAGLTKCFHLKGGMMSWQKAALPLIKN